MSAPATKASQAEAGPELDLAALGGRSYAFVLDWHFRFVAALLWFAVGLWARPDALRLHDNPLLQVGSAAFDWVVVPSLLIYFLYHPVLEVLQQGYTPGKRMAGVRIVSKDGTPAPVLAHIVRNILRLIDSLPLFYLLGMIVCVSSKRYQRLGDMLAGTVLVYAESEAQQRRRAILNSQGQHALSLAQREVVAELLARWSELNAGKRHALAQALLTKLGQPLPQTGGRQLDAALRQHLQRLFK